MKLERVSGVGLARSDRPGSEVPAAAPEAQKEVLDALRDKIAHILAKSPPPARATHPAASGDLDFFAEETPVGTVHVRRRTYTSAHRVGRAGVRPAAAASMEMVALLSLDPTLAPHDPAGALYLDTETTGLSGGVGTVAFLVGLGYFEAGRFVVEQLLLRQLGEEAPLLHRVAERVARASLLVSYNGKSFDLPMLKTRCIMSRMPVPEARPHVDLLHVARRVHKHRLAQVTLGAIESEVLGFVRTCDVPSAEIPARYFHYLRTGDASPLEAVVDHNAWDVVSMAALLGLYGEPLSGLAPIDLVGIAKTLRRAKSLDRAHAIIDHAVSAGAGAPAVRARAEIAKARGDKALALADFETLVDTVDDPAIRLALAKLYEHHAKRPIEALRLLALGTGEGAEGEARRRKRLERKAKRKG
jgi:uncharacterized protein